MKIILDPYVKFCQVHNIHLGPGEKSFTQIAEAIRRYEYFTGELSQDERELLKTVGAKVTEKLVPGCAERKVDASLKTIFLALMAMGWGISRAAKVIGVGVAKIYKELETDKEFATMFDKYRFNNGGMLAVECGKTLMTQVKAGHPFFFKVALHNFETGLINPDIAEAKAIHEQTVEATGPTVKRYLDIVEEPPDSTQLQPLPESEGKQNVD